MIGDQERQRLAGLKAHYIELTTFWEDHKENIYKQISDTDKKIDEFSKELKGVEKEVEDLK